MRTLALVLCCLGSAAGAQTITDASYSGPTDRYPHGVLGDDIEYTQLDVTLSDGRVLSASYEATLVFEDVAPRLWDVTGDGAPEVVTVESHEAEGGRLVIWGLENGQLRQIARTPFIGTRFRWLAPIGAADLDGDGQIEVAYIDRPHLAKTLRVWRYTPDGFNEVATLPGLTNHRIGEDYITGGLRDCGQGPEMIVADASWRNIMSVTFGAGGLEAEPIGRFEGRASVDVELTCP
ncbi:FG-GAP repeat domain-containing protein [Aestuariivita boseongensis]|uniref:FG-GAP repeat domain-containing protein n=1 Tax=Aestuariivita boseongensis TaxID=1470562 RepID=UPI000681335D|nr:VCBS repeat-containing protein [Aestuariivita boseongensis]